MRRYYPPTTSDIPIHGFSPYDEFHRERVRAHKKHDDGGQSMERKEWLDRAWMEVLVEEVGEVAHELNDVRHNGVFPTGEEYRDVRARVRNELIQCGAMIAAWVESIDEDRCGDVYATRGSIVNDSEDGEPVTCCLPMHHHDQHHSWCGRHQWT